MFYRRLFRKPFQGWAQGREIKGKVVFWAVPFLFKELGRQFVKDLKLDENSAVFPETSQVFVAIGAAIGSREIARYPIRT